MEQLTPYCFKTKRVELSLEDCTLRIASPPDASGGFTKHNCRLYSCTQITLRSSVKVTLALDNSPPA